MEFVFLIVKYIILLSHIDKASGNTNDIFLVMEKDEGVIEIRFKRKIKKNIGIRELFLKFLLVVDRISFLIKLIAFFKNKLCLE